VYAEAACQVVDLVAYGFKQAGAVFIFKYESGYVFEDA